MLKRKYKRIQLLFFLCFLTTAVFAGQAGGSISKSQKTSLHGQGQIRQGKLEEIKMAAIAWYFMKMSKIEDWNYLEFLKILGKIWKFWGEFLGLLFDFGRKMRFRG